MTVGELIKKLEEIGPEVQVFTRGYEGGYQDVNEGMKVDDFILNVNGEWYYGPHERAQDIDSENKSRYKQVKGIVL